MTRRLVSLLIVAALLLVAFPAAADEDADAGAPDAAPASAAAPTPTPTPSPPPPPPRPPPPPPPPPPSPSSSSPPPYSAAPDTTPLTPFPPAEIAPTPLVKITPTGYVEAYYAYNFNHPSNGITNYRGFDNRHNTFTLSNVALGTFWETGPVGGKIMLQIGSTPSTYYSAEPSLAGAGAANASGAETWKYIQEAYVTYKAPVGRGLLLTAGVMASPIGMEAFAVHEHWTWSRSNLFFALPYYHTGVRATYELTDQLTAALMVCNGWNSVVDSNDAKSIDTQLTYRVPERLTVQVLYFGGVERPKGAPEGQYWRNHFDAVGQVEVASWLSLAAQADYGFEPNRFGTAQWYAGAFAARAKVMKWLFFVVRGDRFHEEIATEGGRSTPLFFGGSDWVTSGTATVDVRPHDNISFRLELRHDVAKAPLYFTKDVEGDGTTAKPYVPNSRRQTTILLGATAWF